MTTHKKLIVGSRSSRMALAQTNQFIAVFLEKNQDFKAADIEIKPITTTGDIKQKERLDLIGGKGLFVKEIEELLLNKEIHVAVHSMKDMPTIMTPGLKIAAWLKRGDVREALVSVDKKSILELAANTTIGTSSIRRRAQVLNQRRDLSIKLIRGNVDTRIKKLDRGEYDALILGYGGLLRLGLEARVAKIFSTEEILPPACQAAIGIQTLNEDNDIIKCISKTNDHNSSVVGMAERTVLEQLQANCNSPIGVLGHISEGNNFTIKVELFSHDGQEKYSASAAGLLENAYKLADEIVEDIIKQVGINFIKELDILKNDFNYTP